MDSPINAIAAGSAKTSALELRAIEKSSLSSHLGQQAQDGRKPETKNIPRIQVELVSHSETTAFDPLWDGPRLVPSFVAQVLAQAMPNDSERDVTVETAYGTAAPRLSLLVDRTS